MYSEDIERISKENTNFRKVLHTGKYSQIVAMSIPVGGEIGEEIHPDTDQIIYIVDGKCLAIVKGESRVTQEDDIVSVNAGEVHNFMNTGDGELKLFTIYAPPHHKDGTIHVTKEEANEAEGEQSILERG